MKIKNIKVINIQWDTTVAEARIRPSEIEIPDEIIDNLANNKDAISDYLSNVTGYYPSGYKLSQDVLDTTTQTHISKIAYEKYKWNWLGQRNYSREFINTITEEWLRQRIKFPDEFMSLCDFIEQYGFQGELYVCYHEFLDHEYQDVAFMKNLLSKLEYQAYYKDRKES